MKTVFIIWVKSGTIYIAYSQLTILVHCKFLSTGCYREQIVDAFVSIEIIELHRIGRIEVQRTRRKVMSTNPVPSPKHLFNP